MAPGTDVSQWVAHDLRMSPYHYIQRLSLAKHDHTPTGDLISRIIDDINAVQGFVSTALLGIFVNLLSLVGMVGVMSWINWRFTLIALSVGPILFLVVHSVTSGIEAVSRVVGMKDIAGFAVRQSAMMLALFSRTAVI